MLSSATLSGVGCIVRNNQVLTKKALVLAVCTAFGFLAAPAMAQQAPPTTDPPATTGASKTDKEKAEKEKAVQMKALSVVANRYEATSIRMDSVNTVDVLSAKDLQNTAVHNVAEALGLMSGVNVTTTGTGYFGGIDGAARGEGMFASVRGLPSEYNVNLVNGSNVAQGMPYSRSVQLSLLPPSGLQTIVLNKTSTADMDGAPSAAPSISARPAHSTSRRISAAA